MKSLMEVPYKSLLLIKKTDGIGFTRFLVSTIVKST